MTLTILSTLEPFRISITKVLVLPSAGLIADTIRALTSGSSAAVITVWFRVSGARARPATTAALQLSTSPFVPSSPCRGSMTPSGSVNVLAQGRGWPSSPIAAFQICSTGSQASQPV